MMKVGGEWKMGPGSSICRKCGEHVQYLPVGDWGNRLKPHGLDGLPHSCDPKKNVRVYSEEEKKEFQRKRLAGEI